MPQVVEYASPVAHTCASQNEARTFSGVQALRIAGCHAGMKPCLVERQESTTPPFQQLFIEQLPMRHHLFACLDRHRAVEINMKWLHHATVEHDCEVVQHLLGAAYRESGHENSSACFRCTHHEFFKLCDRLGVSPVVSIPVRGLKEHDVRMVQIIEVSNDWSIRGTEIAREHNNRLASIFLYGQFNA